MESADAALLSNVELKIALAKDAEQLTKLLNIYLCPILKKATSDHASIRAKVVKICGTISARLSDEVLLPIEALLALYSSDDHPVLSHLTLNFLRAGIGQSNHIKFTWLSPLLRVIWQRPLTQQRIVFRLLLSIIAGVKGSATKLDIVTTRGEQILLGRNLAACFLLDLAYVKLRSEPVADNDTQRAWLERRLRETSNGLTQSEIDFLAHSSLTAWTASDLRLTRLAILQHVSTLSSILPKSFVWLIAVFGKANIDTSISGVAAKIEQECPLDIEDLSTITDLYDCLLERPSLHFRLKGPIIQGLSNSRQAALEIQHALDLLQLELTGGTKVVVDVLGMFRKFLVHHTPSDAEQHQLLSLLYQQLLSSDIALNLVEHICELVSTLVARSPFTRQIDVSLLQSLVSLQSTTEVPEVRDAIFRCLNKISHKFRTTDMRLKDEIISQLRGIFRTKEKRLSLLALRICRQSFEFNDAIARWLCLLATSSDLDEEVRAIAEDSALNEAFCIADQPLRGRGEDQRQGGPTVQDLFSCFEADFPNAQDVPSHLQEVNIRVLRGFCTLIMLSLYCIPSDEDALQPLARSQVVDLTNLSYLDSRERVIFDMRLGLLQTTGSTKPDINFLVQCFATVCHKEPSIQNLDRLAEILQAVSVRLSEPSRSILTAFGRSMKDIHYDTKTKIAAARIIPYLHSHMEFSDIETILQPLILHDSVLSLLVGARTMLWQKLGLPVSSAISENFNRSTFVQQFSTTEMNSEEIATIARDSLLVSDDKALYDTLQRRMLDSDPEVKLFEAIGFLNFDETLLDMLRSPQQRNEPQIIALGHAIAGWISGANGIYQERALLSLVPARTQLSCLKRQPMKSDAIAALIQSISQLTQHTIPDILRRVCVWFLCLLEDLGHTGLMITGVRTIHSTLVQMLQEKSDQVKMYAAVGLFRCYSIAPSPLKGDLIRDLTRQFPKAAAPYRHEQEISDLMMEIEHATTPNDNAVREQNQISEEYTALIVELCNIANSSGAPYLTYTMLELSYRTSFLQTELGRSLRVSPLTFELASIPTHSQKRLFVRLFRARFHPNKDIATSTKAIYEGLFKVDRDVLAHSYIGNMLEDYMTQASNRDWQEREAALAALDVLIHQHFASLDVLTIVPQLWVIIIRAMDDMKASSRERAHTLGRTLVQQLLKSLESLNSAQQAACLEPTISALGEAMTSPVKDVSEFGLKSLSEFLRTKNSTIVSSLPEIIKKLIFLNESIEPDIWNYLSFHTQKYDISQAQLDSARLQNLQQSTTIAALENCIDILDQTVTPQVVTILCDIIRQSQTVVIKLCTSRFIISMVSRRVHLTPRDANSLIQAYSTIILRDRGLAQQANASALGYLSRFAEDQKLVKLLKFLSGKYVLMSEIDSEAALPVVLHAMSQYANDRIKGLATNVLPLLFLCKFEPGLPSENLFEGSWSRLAASDASVRAYISEVLDLVDPLMSSRIWRVRAMCCYAICRLTDFIPDADIGSTSRVRTICQQNLHRGVWGGKVPLLRALVKATSPRTMTSEAVNEITAGLVQELSNTDINYRLDVIDLLKDHVEQHERSLTLATLQDMLHPTMQSAAPSTRNDKKGDTTRAQLSSFLYKALRCLLAACDHSQRADNSRAFTILESYCVNDMSRETTQEKCHLVKAVSDGVQAAGGRLTAHELDIGWTVVRPACSDTSLQKNREAGIMACKALLGCAESDTDSRQLLASIQRILAELKDKEPDPTLKGVLADIIQN